VTYVVRRGAREMWLTECAPRPNDGCRWPDSADSAALSSREEAKCLPRFDF
jgi:hypothetical protein